jgi:hypothetical protein
LTTSTTDFRSTARPNRYAECRCSNLRSPFGDLDITFSPAGFPDGYDSLRPGAHPYTVGTATIHVADLDDVITSKEAAARPKDLDALPELVNLARARKNPKTDR